MVVARPGGQPGDLQRHPRVEDMATFEIPHGCFVKMESGTWHAGGLGRRLPVLGGREAAGPIGRPRGAHELP
jgi:hypothetical protein